jgi:hypothetical protein
LPQTSIPQRAERIARDVGIDTSVEDYFGRWNKQRGHEKGLSLIMQTLNSAYDPSSRHAPPHDAETYTLPHIPSPAEISCQEA